MATWIAAPDQSIWAASPPAVYTAIILPITGGGFPVYKPATQPPDGRQGWVPAPAAFSLINLTVGVAV